MKNWLRLFLLLGFYSLLFGVLTWPLVTAFSTSFLAVPGPDPDTYGYLWNAWHFRQAVLSGHNPYYTDWMFYPQGTGLLLHAYTPLLGLLNLLLDHEIRTVNVALVLSSAFSGAGAYLLARRWVRSPVLCLLAGFVFAYSPYKLQRLPEHYNLIFTGAVPFYVLAFLRAFRFREGWQLPRVQSWGAAAGCVVLGFVTWLGDYYALFGLLYFSLAYALWFWLRLGNIRWNKRYTWLWLGGLLLGSHIFVRALGFLHVPENGIWWAGDVVAYLLPPPTSRLLHGPWAARLYHNAKVFNMPGSPEITLFLGYALPLLALVLAALRLTGWREPSRRARSAVGRPLAWVLLFFLLLTVPTLRIYGHERLNLPTAALHFVPFINNIRCPTRWTMLVGLFLPIVVGSALEAAWRRRLAPAVQLGGSLLLLTLVLLEYWPRPYWRATTAQVPAVFRQVARLPGTTLVAVPLGVSDGYREIGEMQPTDMYYQTVHQKKLPGGSISIVSPDLFKTFAREPLLRAVFQLQTRPDTLAPVPLTAVQVQQFLRRFDPAAFLISPAYREQPVHRYLRQALAPFGLHEEVIGGYALLTIRRELVAKVTQH